MMGPVEELLVDFEDTGRDVEDEVLDDCTDVRLRGLLCEVDVLMEVEDNWVICEVGLAEVCRFAVEVVVEDAVAEVGFLVCCTID